MKICWDMLEGIHLGERNKELRKGHYTYIEMDKCINCGESYLMNKYEPTAYCCVSCGKHGSGYTHSKSTREKIGIANLGNKKMLGKHHSEETKRLLSKITSSKTGSKASCWKGGVIEKNVPLYDTYAHQIDYVHEVRSVIKDNIKLLEVRCKNCNNWFMPKTSAVQDRVGSLVGRLGGEHNLYCSDECKKSCSVFHQQIWPKDHKLRKVNKSIWYTDTELKIWREEVLKRADYKCEYCDEEATVAHHTRPKKLEPFSALDPDHGLACCKKCHYKYGHGDSDCSTGHLAHIDCK
jgi:hypothetical protein